MSVAVEMGCNHPDCSEYSDSAVTLCENCDDLQLTGKSVCSYCGQEQFTI